MAQIVVPRVLGGTIILVIGPSIATLSVIAIGSDGTLAGVGQNGQVTGVGSDGTLAGVGRDEQVTAIGSDGTVSGID